MKADLVILIIAVGIIDAVLDYSWVAKRLKLNRWKNKYKLPLQYSGRPWYYLGLYRPSHKEKFPYSSTLFVFFTDPYHFLKLVRIVAVVGLTGMPWYWIGIYAVLSHFIYVGIRFLDINLRE